jgi:hypothetical protein
MRVLGITFGGTATPRRPQMVTFVETVMNIPRRPTPDVEADLFVLADGPTFAVTSPHGMGDRVVMATSFQ